MAVTITFRDTGPWGAGVGRLLTKEEFDENNYALKQAVEALQSVGGANEIANFTQTGSQFTVVMADGATFGPYDLPLATWRDAGEWAATTAYYKNDVISRRGSGVYRVLQDHTSEATFDAAASNSAGDYYSLLISAPNPAPIKEVTTSTYTPVAGDANKYLRYTNVLGCVVTLDSDAFYEACELHHRQCTGGPVIIQMGDTGGVLNVPTGFDSATDTIGAVCTTKMVGTDEWDIFGHLAVASG